MKTLVVYDSFFGNTEKVAQAVGSAMKAGGAVETRVGDLKPDSLDGVTLLIVGSPTRAFRPTKAITAFLRAIPAGGLRGVRVASFDTRVSTTDVNSRFLNVMVKAFGYAAEPMASRLVKKGGVLATAPEGFLVKDSEGPLKEGELERAGEWAKRAATAV